MAGLDLGKMVGPLPLGAWIAAGAAGVGGALYINSHRKPATAPTADAALTGEPTITQSPLSGYVNANGANSGPSGSGSATTIQDNAQWKQYATSLLIASGYAATVVDTALSKYLEGQALNTQEQAILELALRKAGPPPFPAPLAPTVPGTPTTTPPPAPTLASLGLVVGVSNIYQAAGHPEIYLFTKAGKFKHLTPNEFIFLQGLGARPIYVSYSWLQSALSVAGEVQSL